MGEKAKTIAMTAVIALFLISSVVVLFGTSDVTAAPGQSLPGVPTELTAVPGIYQVSLSWAAPISDGGSAIDYYIIYQDGVELSNHSVGTSAVITGLDLSWMFDGSYSFTVAAHNAQGTGPQSDAAMAAPITVPLDPRRVEATPGDRQVAVSWMPPDQYIGSPILYYIVFMDGVDVLHTNDYSKTFTGLTDGQTYVFSVVSHNIAGNSTGYNMTAVPLTIPEAPTGLTAIPGNGSVSLSWTAPNDGGSAIWSYIVLQDGAMVNGTDGTSITIDSLTNGHTYAFSVYAQNIAGEGPASISVSATPRPNVASVPSITNAIPGNVQVTLSWSIPADNGGAPIDYYEVYQNGINVKNFTGSSGVITGLTNGHSYSFTVAAHNAAGTGVLSTAVTETPYTAPDAPTGLGAIPGDGQVRLNWTAPAFDEGREIDYYVVYQDGVALPYHQGGPTAVISGLSNGREYSFTVSGHNLAGIGLQSTAMTAKPSAAPTSVPSVPDAPTGLTAVPGDGQVTLSWSAPTGDSGAPIDHYIVFQDGTEVQLPAGASTTISGLTNGHTYTFSVAAHNFVGNGTQSSGVPATPVPAPTVPGVPTGLTATPGNSQVSLTWTAPINNGGAAIDYYLVYVNGDAGPSHYSTASATITGLKNDQQYNFAIAAHNSVGVGTQSSAITVKPTAVATLPGVPTGLTATAGNAQITLSWAAPSSNGGAAIDYYIVYRDGVDTFHPTAPTKIINDLSNGHSYNFTVAAHNSVGTGPQTSPVSAKPGVIATIPGTPTNLTVTPGEGQVTLSWTAPSNGSSFDYYIVYQDGVDVTHTSVNSTKIFGLTDGNVYSFSVAAHSPVGVGVQSSAQSISPGASGSAATAASSGNLDLIVYVGILAFLAISITVMYLVIRRRRDKA